MYKDRFPLTILRHAGSGEPHGAVARVDQEMLIKNGGSGCKVLARAHAFTIATVHVSCAAIVAAISSGDASSQSTTISP